jgi:fructose-bisphosphate aldolase, class II
VPVPTQAQYREMLDAARRGGYALAAVNVTSSETLNAAMRGFAEARADGIVQVTTGGAAYISGDPVGDPARGAIALAGLARELADAYPVLVGVHTDHCPPDQVES